MKLFLFTSLFLAAAASLGSVASFPHQKSDLFDVHISPLKVPISTPANFSELANKVSDTCTNALFSIVAEPEFLQCIPVADLLEIFANQTLLPAVLADPLHNIVLLEPLFVDTCKRPKCSDKLVTGAIATIQKGCDKELKEKNKFISLLLGAAILYSPARDIVCLTSDKKVPCLIQTASDFLALPKPKLQITKNPQIDSILLADPPKVCTDCNKGIVDILVKVLTTNVLVRTTVETIFKITDDILKLAEVGVAFKCGQDFLGI